jgi:uncharacterized protein YjbJ (UPF0337 family)
MSIMDKLRNKLTMSKGHAKQAAGRATDDPYMEGRGQAERVEGAGRQAGEHVKDTAKDARDAFKN